MKFDINLEALKKNILPYLLPYLEELKDFQFSYRNPLFWAGLFIIFLILLRVWDERKKAFSYSVMLAVILLGMTRLELYTLSLFGEPSASFLIRTISLFIIALVFIYHAFIR